MHQRYKGIDTKTVRFLHFISPNKLYFELGEFQSLEI